MPAYSYRIPEAGLNVTLLRPVERRDDPVEIRRVTVPESLAISGATANPYDFDAQQRKGYRKLEEQGKLRGRREFSNNQVRAILDAPRPKTTRTSA